MFIELDEKELDAIGLLAKLQFDLTRSLPEHKMDDEKSEKRIVYEGVIGEYIVSKGLVFPFGKGITGSGDGGNDLVLDELTVQIKYTSRTNRLMFNHYRKFDAEMAILVRKGDTYRQGIVKGWIGQKEFEDIKQSGDPYGKGFTEWVEARDLNKIQRLREHFNRSKAFDNTCYMPFCQIPYDCLHCKIKELGK